VTRPSAASDAAELADVFCRNGRRFVAARFGALWRNDDRRKHALGLHVLEGRDTWLEQGIVGLRREAGEMAPVQPEPRKEPVAVPPSRPGATPAHAVEEMVRDPRA
jgi:hypothetical protein